MNIYLINFIRETRLIAKEGNGLGMAMVKRVLELMDGEIQVLSEEKQGSTFIVTLPMAGKEFGQL